MDATVLAVFAAVYLGMILGEIPGLALDRTGVALLGAIAIVAFGSLSPEAAWAAVDVPTMALLLGLMVVSAQFRLGGFYSFVTQRLTARDVTPPVLLAEVVALAGALSAVLVNDIVCLAIAPILADVCSRRRLDPVPYLLALACAANVGSAATLMGNPQNMLIGQTLRLPFARYLLDAGLPSLLGLLVVWGVIARAYRKRWHRDVAVVAERRVPTFDRWQTGKGLLVLGMVVALFLATSLPREAVALSAAGVLLMSRRMASRDILGLVDWHLLVLFVGLFVVNHALEETGMLARATSGLLAAGIDVGGGWWAFGMAALLSNLVSNVPAVMLLLPAAEGHPMAGPMLALSSTLAGNLLIVGSIANIIVVEQAGRQGINIGWREHARVGVPVTLITLGLAAGWLAMLGDW